MNFFRKFFWHSPVHYVIAVLIAGGFSCAVLFTKGAGSTIMWMDALTTGGAIAALFGLLLLSARLGSFEIFGYSFRKFGGRTDKDFYAYMEENKQKRSAQEYTFMPYITVGLLFIVTGMLIRPL